MTRPTASGGGGWCGGAGEKNPAPPGTPRTVGAGGTPPGPKGDRPAGGGAPRREDPLVGQIGDRTVGARDLEARSRRSVLRWFGEQPELREVDATVLGDDHGSIDRERGSIRPATSLGEARGPSAPHLDSNERAV